MALILWLLLLFERTSRPKDAVFCYGEDRLHYQFESIRIVVNEFLLNLEMVLIKLKETLYLSLI